MPKKIDYTALNQELDDVLAALQQPNVPVDEALVLYARGQKLITQLERYLQEAENSITVLKLRATDEEGEAR